MEQSALLLHCLNLYENVQAVSDEEAAALQRRVPGQTVVLAVDACLGRESANFFPPGVDAAPVIGRVQDHFARDIADIRSFFEGQTEPRLTLSSIARSEETRRFVFAQMAVLFLGLTGIALLWATVRSLWS